MLAIGEFSKATGLSLKALRLYHDAGILVPTLVDRDTGYRYYDFKNVEQAKVVTALRQMMFSLDQIAALMKGSDQTDLLGFLESHQAQIDAKMREMKQARAALDGLIKEEKQARALTDGVQTGVEEMDVAPLLIAGIRVRGVYADSGKAFAQLGRSLGRAIDGPPLTIHYDVEYKETDADFECCFPVTRAPKGVEARELAGGRAVTVVHKGPYQQLGRSYARMFAHVNERGYQVVAPLREVFLKGPGLLFRGNPSHYVTRIHAFVGKAKP